MPNGVPRGVGSLMAVLGCACQSHAISDQAHSNAAPQSTGSPVPAMPSSAVHLGADLDPPQARRLRLDLVTAIAANREVRNERVLQAMREVPRHLFVDGVPLELAYADHPLPIGSGQTISQPTIVALMTGALNLSGRERVLEIGTGSGYQAAVLSMLASEVFSIELIPELGREAAERLRRLGYANIHVHIGDGYAGWPERAPFDRIVVTAAPPSLPQVLLDELSDQGILVAPIGEEHGEQTLYRFRKRDGTIVKEDLGGVRFVPMVSDDQQR